MNIYNENIWEKGKNLLKRPNTKPKKKEFEFYLTFVSSTVLAYFILAITGVILAINNPDLKLDSSILGWFINNHFFHKFVEIVEKLDKKLY